MIINMGSSTYCLFCQEKNIPYEITSSCLNEKEEIAYIDEGPSFSKLCEYLKINVDRDWWQGYNDFRQLSGDINHGGGRAGDCTKLLCFGCFELADKLRKLYEDLEKIQKEIEECCKGIKKVIITTACKSETKNIPRKRGRLKRKCVDRELEFVEAFQALVKGTPDSGYHAPLEDCDDGRLMTEEVIVTRNAKRTTKTKKVENQKTVKSDRTISDKPENDDNALQVKSSDADNGAIVKIEVDSPDEQVNVAEAGELDGMLLDERADFDGGDEADATKSNAVLMEESTEEKLKAENSVGRKSKRISSSKNHLSTAAVTSKGRVTRKRKLKQPASPDEGSNPDSKLNYTCRICHAKFRLAHQYYTHRKSHLPTKQKTLDIRNVYGIENGRKTIVARICSICGHKVNGRKLPVFMEHMLSHENLVIDQSSTLYSCDQCDKQFSIELNLDLHKLYNHDWQNVLLKCEFCGNASTTQAEFVVHLKTHEGVTRTHSCKSCPMVCTSFDKLLDHMVKHSRSKQLYCPECPSFMVPTIKELYQHCGKVHPDIKEKFSCQHCGKAFLLPATLRNHQRNSHGIGDNDDQAGEFFCTQCNTGKVYKSRKSLERHVHFYHNNEDARYKCDQCENKTFLYKSLLQKHIQEKHDRIRYPCPHCPKSYSEQIQLGHHMKTHTGEGLLPCPVCGKLFPRKSQLKTHLVVHEKKGAEKSFVCEHCGKGFYNEFRLRQHKRNHKEKNMECPHCKMLFRRRENYQSHLRTHTGERPYVCPVESCSKAFNRRDILIVHMKCHGMNHEEAKQFYKEHLDNL